VPAPERKKLSATSFPDETATREKKNAFFFARVEGKDTAVVKRHTDVLNTSEPLDS